MHHIPVPRTARYHTLGPAPAEGAEEVWVVLHGYRQLAGRFLRRFRGLADGRRLLVAPEGLSRFYVERETGRHGPHSVVGASWMTRDDREHEIADYVRYLDLLAARLLEGTPRERVHLTVLGFSQGVATACRWSVLGSWPPERLVAWGDTLPPDLPEDRARERLGRMELVSVRGDADRTRRADAEEDEAERLARWGIDRTVVTWPGGHAVDPGLLERLARR